MGASWPAVGQDVESIRRTIEAGANAIIYTPPSTAELFRRMMEGLGFRVKSLESVRHSDLNSKH